MSTQTGSISFESTKGLHSYAKQNYETLSQVIGQFATCDTGASTAAKVATIVPADSSWTLSEGATVTVKFTNKNTATAPTLNVNSKGAKPIKDSNGNDLTEAAREWLDGAAISLTYDGTCWRIQDSNLMERIYSAETDIEQNADAITLRATKQEVNNIQVGGRNLVLGTGNLKKGSTAWSYRHKANNESLIQTTDGVKYDSTSSNAGIEFKLRSQDCISDNEMLTISFEVRGTMTSIKSLYFLRRTSAGADTDNISYGDFMTFTDISETEWTRYTHTWSSGSSATAGGTKFPAELMLFWGKTNVGWIEIKNGSLKLEKGNKATDWTPAPEDMATAAELKITNDSVSAKVDKNGVIASINASVEEENGSLVKISADKVNIEGAAIFSTGGAYNTSTTVVKTETQWYSSNSPTVKDDGDWSTTQPNINVGRYIWQREKITYANGTTAYEPSNEGVCIQGQTDLSSYSTTTQMNSAIGNVLGGFDILWNYSTFTTANNGECYICKCDPLTKIKNDADGWVIWNNVKRTIPKGMANPNAIHPFNIPIYIVCRLSSADATTGTNYMVSYNSGWKGGVVNAGALSDWTWVETTDIILGKFVATATEGAITDFELYNPPRSVKQITTITTTAQSAQTTANNAAPKTSAVSRTQRIYWRATSTTGKPEVNSTWLSASGTGYNNWALTVPQLTNGSTKYPYLYTAVQSQTVAQQAAGTGCSCSPVLLDDTTTVIDGGNIITGSVNANAINASTINGSNLTISNFKDSNDYLNSNIQIGGRNLFSWPLTGTKWKDEEHSLNDYQNKGSFTQFSGSLLFDPAETLGEQYTISFWAKSPNGSTPLQLYNSNGNPKYFYFSAEVLTNNLGNEWQYFSYTVTNIQYNGTNTPSTNNNYIRRIEIYAPNQMGVLVKKIKVEKGNKATDWTLAPEDVEASIEELSDYTNSIRNWYAICPTPAATAAKLATINPVTADFTTSILTPGTVVFVKFDTTNSAAVGDLTLNVNNTGAKPIKQVRNGTVQNLPGVGYLAANATYQFTYDGTNWLYTGNYDSNSNDNARYVQFYNTIVAGEALVAASIIGGRTDGKFYQIKENSSFDLSSPLLWLTTALAKDATNYANIYTQCYDRNLGTYYTSFANTTANRIVYLVGTVNGNIFTTYGTNSSQYLTINQPTTEDGKFYIPIGRLGNSSNGKNYFNYQVGVPITLYAYIDGKFRQVTPTEIVATQKIYYRSKVSGNVPVPKTWITLKENYYNETISSGINGWSTKVTPMSKDKTSNTAANKYLYLYTCEQRKRLDGTVECIPTDNALLDDSTTIIDGGNIITGSIDANRINANSISTSNLTVSNFSDSNDYLNSNIQIGGRNLLKNTEHPSSNDLALTNATLLDNGEIQLNSDVGTVYTKYKVNYLSYSEYKNNTYTLTFDAKLADSSSDKSIALKAYILVNPESRYSSRIHSSYDRYKGKTYDNITSDWVRYYHTVEIPDGFTSGVTSALVDTSQLTVGFTVEDQKRSIRIRKIKLEVGNKATDWTPAPEDIDAEISNVSDIANAAAPKTSAVAEEQYIYKQATSGTTSMSQNTSWVTSTTESVGSDTTGQTPIWTTKRPTYRSNYPVIFVAKQKKTVSGTVTCSTPVKDDTTTIIDGGHITTGTIDTNRLNANTIKTNIVQTTDLNASKITSGYISANRIEAGSLGADKIDVSSINIGNLSGKIGGRNLARMTSELNNSSWWTTTKVTSVTGGQNDPEGGTNAYLITPSETNWNITQKTGIGNLVNVGETYTFSVWLKAESNTKCKICARYIDSDAPYSSNASRKEFDITTNWERYQLTGILNTAQSSTSTFWIGQGTGSSVPVYIYHPKVEIGNRATDWSPAPEDVDSAINDASKTASNYITKISNEGISVHSAENSDNRIHINSYGMGIYGDDNSVGSFMYKKNETSNEYETTVRLGTSAGARFVISDNILEAYDKSNNRYFKLDANSLQYGIDQILSGTVNENLFTFTSDTTLMPRTYKGLTFTRERDGWIQITGTATDVTSNGYPVIFGSTSTSVVYTKVPAGTYTFFAESEGDNVGLASGNIRVRVTYKTAGATAVTNTYLAKSTPLTLTFNEFYGISLVVSTGVNDKTINGRIRIKMEKGSKATPWVLAKIDNGPILLELADSNKTYTSTGWANYSAEGYSTESSSPWTIVSDRHGNVITGDSVIYHGINSDTSGHVFVSATVTSVVSATQIHSVSHGMTDTKSSLTATNAGKTATNYMSFDTDNGLRIASSNPASAKQRIQIASNKISMFDINGQERLSLINPTSGETTVTVGRSNQGHVNITDSGISIYGTNGGEAAYFGATSSSGDIAYARIGHSTNSRFEVTPTALRAYTNNSTTPFFEVTSNGLKYGGNNTAATTTQVSEETSHRKAIYGTCSTDSETDIKVVICNNFEAYVGAKISVKFSKANITVKPTLKIQNASGTQLLAAKDIWNENAVASIDNPILWSADATITFIYDGSVWVVDNKPASYSASCNTEATQTIKRPTVTGAVILNGTTITVNFTTANTVNSTLMLAVINNDFAFIYKNGAAVSQLNQLLWNANTDLTFTRKGRNWYLNSRSDASETATNYMSFDSDNGLKIAQSNPSGTDDYYVQIKSDGIYNVYDELNYTHQTASSFDIYAQSLVASYGSTITIGKTGTNDRNVYINSDGVNIRQGTTNLAQFGSTVTIGKTGTNDRNVYINSDGVNIRQGTTNLAEFKTDGIYFKTGTNGLGINLKPGLFGLSAEGGDAFNVIYDKATGSSTTNWTQELNFTAGFLYARAGGENSSRRLNTDTNPILFYNNSKISYYNSSGNIANVTSLSDKRLKIDLGILKQNEAISFIKSLIPHKYEIFGDKELGFFAQDVEKNSIYGDILVQKYEDHGYKDCRSLDYQSLIAPTIAALQGALEKIEKLEAKIEALENK